MVDGTEEVETEEEAAPEVEEGAVEEALSEEAGDETEEAEVEEPGETEEAEVEEPDETPDELETLKAATRKQEVELAYLRGREIQRQEDAKAGGQVEEDEGEEEESDDVLLEGLKTVPVPTVKKIVAKAVEKATAQLRQEFKREKTTDDATRQAYQNDIAMSFEKVPEARDNPELQRRGTLYFNAMVSDAGGYRPGFLALATKAAYADMVREGLLVPGQASKKPAEPGKNGLKKKIEAARPEVKSKAGVVPGVKGDPFSGLKMSKEEREDVMDFCKSSGVKLADWRKSYDAAAKQQGDSYGRD